MIWTPHATVAAIVEDNEGRLLMVEESSHGKIVYNQPAGHIEENETVLDAVRRETLEETGWEIVPLHLLGIYVYKAPANGVTYYRFCYSARAVRRVTDQLDSDIIAAHWLKPEQIEALGHQLRSPLVLQCIEDYRKGRCFPLDLIRDPQT